MTTPERIKQLRTSVHLSQSQMADLLQCSIDYYRRLEYGSAEPKGRILQTLSSFFDVSVEWILYGEEATGAEVEDEISAFRRKKLSLLLTYIGMSDTQFADEVGVSRPLITDGLNGLKPITNRTIHKICERYQIDPNYFLADLPIASAFKSVPTVVPSTSLGDRVKVTRLKRHMTIKELAKEAGVTSAFISQVENDLRGLGPESCQRIAKALKVTQAYLLHGQGGIKDYPLNGELLEFLEQNFEARRMVWEMMEAEGE